MPKRKDEDLHLGAKDVPWKCACGFLLGVLSPDTNTLRIKYKDLYLSIEGKDVKVTELCRRCATPNKIESTPEVPEVPPEHKEAFEKVPEKASEK